MINKWLLESALDIVDFFIKLIKSILKTAGSSIPIVDTWYNVFIGICGTLLICIILFRVLMTTIHEGDGSAEATATNILVDAVKACGATPVMMFIQKHLYLNMVIPILNYFFAQQSKYTKFSVDGIEGLEDQIIDPVLKFRITGFVFILLVGFFAVVLIVFFVKMSIFLAQLVFFTLSVPFCAISIASDKFEYASMWWKKLIYLNISVVAQVIALTLMLYSFSKLPSVLYFMLVIGAGVLIVKAPLVIEDLWASTGTARAGGRLMSTGAMLALRKLILKA